MQHKKITIFGAGAWGTALAQLWSDLGYEVLLWTVQKPVLRDINFYHKNTLYAPRIKLVQTIQATSDLKTAVDFASIYLLTIPTSAFLEVIRELKPFLDDVNTPPGVVINAAKGLVSGQLPLAYLRFQWGTKHKYLGIYGAAFAHNLLLRQSCCFSLVSQDQSLKELPMFKGFKLAYLRSYWTVDETASQWMVVLKNLYAIISGIINAADAGINYYSVVFTGYLEEIRLIALKLNFPATAIFEVANFSDLFLTCTSASRNYGFGFWLGRHPKFHARNFFKTRKNVTIEGYASLTVVLDILATNYDCHPILLTLLAKFIDHKVNLEDFLQAIFDAYLPQKT